MSHDRTPNIGALGLLCLLSLYGPIGCSGIEQDVDDACVDADGDGVSEGGDSGWR